MDTQGDGGWVEGWWELADEGGLRVGVVGQFTWLVVEHRWWLRR